MVHAKAHSKAGPCCKVADTERGCDFSTQPLAWFTKERAKRKSRMQLLEGDPEVVWEPRPTQGLHESLELQRPGVPSRIFFLVCTYGEN